MKLPKISIVMPSYNQAQFLEQAINSVLSQAYPDIELIVMDGGSTDGSKKILQTLNSRISYWASEQDGGQSDALNKGFEKATGEIFGWLNSDDMYQPGAFESVAKVFSDEQVKVAMCDHIGLMDSSGRVFEKKLNRFNGHKALIRFWATDGMTISQPSVFFRRSAVENLSPIFDVNLDYAMDYDLWLRLSASHRLVLVHGYWSNYRFHESSKSGKGFEEFFPEWLSVSQRHWGTRNSVNWWANQCHYLYHFIKNTIARRIIKSRASDSV